MAKKNIGTLNDPVRVIRRAQKFASRDHSRPIICGVHLDECGDVVSTDSYRIYVEHGAWDGPNIDLPFEACEDIMRAKVKGNATCTVEHDETCEVVRVKMANGIPFVESTTGGTFPQYGKFFEGECVTIAYVKPKELEPLLKQHAKLNQQVRIDVIERDFHIIGIGEEPKPEYMSEKACDGENVSIGFNATYLRDALAMCGEVAEIRIESGIKPAIVASENIEVCVMPIRLDTNEPRPTLKPRKSERNPKAPTKATDEELARSIYRIALDRAASDPDGRVEGGNASSYDRNLIFEYERSGQLTKLECGDYTSWYREGKFLTCIERRWSKRKIHLTYPELKPRHYEKEDKAAALKVERAAKENAGADVKATVNEVDDGITAITIEPKKPELKEDNDMELSKRIEELEAELKAARKELDEVWKENATLKAKPKREEKPKQKPEPKDDAAATVSLSALTEQMQAWCKERENVVARRKNDQLCTPVRVEGDTRPYKDELTELGFRYAKKGFWYYGERQAAEQGKKVVA